MRSVGGNGRVRRLRDLVEALGLERHYSVGEIAERWGLSEKTIRRMFENEEGVLQWGSPETRRKRGYITLRIL